MPHNVVVVVCRLLVNANIFITSNEAHDKRTTFIDHISRIFVCSCKSDEGSSHSTHLRDAKIPTFSANFSPAKIILTPIFQS